MCGIACFVGDKKPASFLINILKKLEYRGYDSSGFASLNNGKIIVKKRSGNIKNLEESLNDDDIIDTAISHTRWATHGKPNEINAHPHLSKNKTWAVVHNGIIENYKEIKERLKVLPESETDTAVISELLEECFAKNIYEFIDAIKNIEGSFAIAAINKDQSKTIFLAKEKSPLYVAENKDGEFLIASDPICFVEFSKYYYAFDDGEFAEVSDGKIKFFNKQKKLIEKYKVKLNIKNESISKQEYEHFMLKEIMEEKQAILNQVKNFEELQILEKFDDWFLTKFNEIKFIGCGTAYHAGLMGAKYVQKILNKKASAEMASEFLYNEPNFISEKTLYIFVSQSGETADTLRALEIAKSFNAKTIALTNVMYSSLAQKADSVLPISAGVEIAVASTKAYVCMLSALYLFCKYFKGKKEYEIACSNLTKLANNILDFDIKKLDKISKKLKDKSEAIFIGKDMDYITALEASLKLKEITYINANAYPAGELKHGFLALVEKDTPLFVFLSQEKIKNKTISAMSEAESRGAESIVFEMQNEDFIDKDNFVVCQNFFDECLSQIQIIAPMQYLAYKVSLEKGLNPDQPRNLAKSVTVE